MASRSTTLRRRLLNLAALSVVVVAALLATSTVTNRGVEGAYQSIDKAQTSIQSAKEAIEAADALKQRISRAVQDAMALRLLEKTYLQFQQASLVEQFERDAAALTPTLQQLKLDSLRTEFEDYHALFKRLVTVQSEHRTLKTRMVQPLEESSAQLSGVQQTLEARQSQLQMEGANLSPPELEMMNVARDCRLVFLQLQNLQQQFITTGDAKFVAQYKGLVTGDGAQQIRSLKEFAASLGNTNFIAASTKVAGAMDSFLKEMNQSLDYIGQEKDLVAKLNARGEGILQAAAVEVDKANAAVTQQREGAGKAQALVAQARDSAASTKRSARVLLIAITLGGLLLYAWFFFRMTRSLNRSLGSTIANLETNARETAEAADRIMDRSTALSTGATRQAAALQESSHSLRAMAEITGQNTQSAGQARDLARQSRVTAEQGADQIQRLSAAMGAIRTSSSHIAAIIRTIDEIAFQTNLLALNAAVEAARAGEAGLGFAVVATEVRNLARRSADAARETANKIEGALAATEQGVTISGEITNQLNEIVAQIRKVDDISGQVASASEEQSRRVSQVLDSLNQMEEITQENAVGAEDGAHAARDLQSQATALRESMEALQSLVAGGTDAATPAASDHPTTPAPLEPENGVPRTQPTRPRAQAEDPAELTTAF